MTEDMLYEDSSKIFVDVRFVLIGFDPLRKEQIRSKLVEGGGVDAGKYGPDCTHLIVDSIIYDDPICVSARRVGKIVVTSLWVAHSFDLGMPVDHHSVMYRPPRNLNGIPGAKSLIVCLTGYQRQDRDDIMTMVGLMGANFSKPLVANKVTHLICYKFEGEKYELAKKMKTIKLVNHQWLEDCLKSWEILSEAEYAKSGYELDMMEAEAKDSEDENEGIAANRSAETIAIMGPEYPKSPNQFLVKQEASTNISDLNIFRGLSGLGNTKELSLSASKQSKSDQVPAFEESPNRHDEMLNSNFCRTKEEPPSSMQQNGSDLVSVSNSARKSPHSCSSREFPRKFSSPMTSEHMKSYSGSPAATEAGIGYDCFNLSSQRGLEKSELGVKTPKNLSFSGKGQSSRLPEKRNMGISDSSFKSPRTGNNPESIPDGYLTANRSEELINSSKLHSLSHGGSHLLSTNPAPHLDKGVTLETMQHYDSTISNPATLSTGQGHDEDAPQSSTCMMMGSKGTSHATVDVSGPLDERHDVPSPVNERRDTLKSNVLSEFNKAGDDSMSGSKTLKKRSLSKKTLGSRQSLGKGDGRNQKGSLLINKTVLTNDSAASSSGGREETEHQNILSSTKGEVLPADNADSSKEIERNNFLNSEKESAKTNESLNDDTEAPEDQEDEELNVLREKSTGTEAQHSGLQSAEKKINANKMVHKNDRKDIAKSLSTESNEFETQKTSSGKETKLSQSTSVGKASEEKVPEGPKCLKKNSKKTNLATKRAAASVEGALSTESNEFETQKTSSGKETKLSQSTSVGKASEEKVPEGPKCLKKNSKKTNLATKRAAASVEGALSTESNEFETQKTSGKETKLSKSTSVGKASEEKVPEGPKCLKKNSKKTNLATKRAAASVEGALSTESNEFETQKTSGKETKLSKSTSVGKASEEKVPEGPKCLKKNSKKTNLATKRAAASVEGALSTESNEFETQKTSSGKETKLSQSTSVGKASEEKVPEGPKCLKKNSKKTNLATKRAAASVEGTERKKCRTDRNKVEAKKGKGFPSETGKATVISTENQLKSSMDVEKENMSVIGLQNAGDNEHEADRSSPSDKKSRSLKVTEVQSEPRWFIVSGHRLQRKEFQQVIKRLKGKVCRDSHHWSYQATHFIVPAPVRRTEKFFAAASSGRWILKTDYLTACVEAGKLLDEEPYEWHKKGLTEDLAINLEAPRKWRLLRERTGHGALYGMRIIIYGDCIVPPLDTLKCAVKAGDGIILATSPPYSRFLESGVDFAIVSEVMPRCDKWVQEFLRHEIPCVLPDYLVTYVCKPGYTLNNYVQYNTHSWAERSLKKHINRLEEIVEEMEPSDDSSNDIACQVCGSPDRGEVMLICGDESGSLGCGIGMHVDCCDPPLECVPEEDWFCPECSKNISNTSTKRKSKKGTSNSKKKKK
ncbi:BRCT domain-containing protein At4g02110-like [Solanum tuberosum]|uniref:BRCT domain-containing protein At4g02110-like n=1 Tax=Solanum tuberosum TaxID=4113 RepID=UPI00073A0D12|nr:PREDICTED: BRCT domain-containing protein At4g02110-like [Solanum tuberosum]